MMASVNDQWGERAAELMVPAGVNENKEEGRESLRVSDRFITSVGAGKPPLTYSFQGARVQQYIFDCSRLQILRGDSIM